MANGTGDYRALLAHLMSPPLLTATAPVGENALSKLVQCGLLCTEDLATSVIQSGLDTATHRYGNATVLCYVQYTSTQYEAVAAYLDDSKLVVENRPIQLVDIALRSGPHDLQLFLDSAALFRVPTWIARTVFGLKNHRPCPFLSQVACVANRLAPPLLQDVWYKPLTLTNVVRQLELVVGDTATHCEGIDASEANVMDVLHCFGVVYIGSVNEVTSQSEIGYLGTALTAVGTGGFRSLWWLEDFTLFKQDMYTLVFRFQHTHKGPYYQRRQLQRKNKTQLVDLQTNDVSPPVVFHQGTGEFHFQAFNKWISSLLGQRCYPYMRHEIVEPFLKRLVVPDTFTSAMRPYLKNGAVTNFPPEHMTKLPPRLFYSWDVFLKPTRFPPDANPCTVHFVVEIKSWEDDPEFRLLLRIDGDQDHVYRLFFRQDGESFPEPDQLKAHVESEHESLFGPDGINVVILRRAWEPYGTTVVEVVLTTYYKPFKLYVDSRVCDLTFRATVLDYRADSVPRVLPTMAIPVFTQRVLCVQRKQNVPYPKAIQRTLDKIKCQRQRELIPIVLATTTPGLDSQTYTFLYWDDGNLVSL